MKFILIVKHVPDVIEYYEFFNNASQAIEAFEELDLFVRQLSYIISE